MAHVAVAGDDAGGVVLVEREIELVAGREALREVGVEAGDVAVDEEVIDVVVVDELRVSAGQRIDTLGELDRPRQVAAVGCGRATTLGGDDDDTVGRLGTVGGCGSRTLDDVDGGDVLQRQVVEGAHGVLRGVDVGRVGVIVAHTVDVDDRVAVHTERSAAAHVEADGHTHLTVRLEHLHTANASVDDVGQVRACALIHEPLHVHLVDLRSDGLGVACAGDTGGDDHFAKLCARLQADLVMVDEVKGGEGLRLIADVGDGDRVAPCDGQVVGTLFVGDGIRPVSGDEVHAGQRLARFVVYHASLHASLCQGRGGGAEQKEEGEQIKLRSSFCHTVLLLQLI